MRGETRMKKTGLFAFLMLLSIGGIVAMEFGTPSLTHVPVSEPTAQTTAVAVSELRDTLTKADRLPVSYVRNEAPPQPLPSLDGAPTAGPALIGTPEPQKITSRHWHDPNAKQVAVAVIPKPKSKTAASKAKNDSRKTGGTNRSKAVAEIKSCRSNPFDTFLKALNLSPGCET